MRRMLQHLLCAWILTGAALAFGAPKQLILSVQEVVREAAKLDGKIVLVRGSLIPTVIPEWRSTLFHELLSTSSGPQGDDQKIGLIDWSPDLGISESQYRPESFDRLASVPNDRSSLGAIVVMRAVVSYKKGLRAKIPPVLPGAGQVSMTQSAHHDVELIVLEILSVKKR